MLAPASEAITPVAMPTGPVPPKIIPLLSFNSIPCFVLSSLSTQATSAAAVVNAPAGSANTETSKGGTIASFAASNIFIAKSMSRPPIKTAVFFTPFGSREKIASCNNPLTCHNSTFAYGITTS